MCRSGRDWYSPDSHPQVLGPKWEKHNIRRGLPKERGGSESMRGPRPGVLHWKDEPPGHMVRDLKTG